MRTWISATAAKYALRGQLAQPQHGHAIDEDRHAAELVRQQQHPDLPALGHVAKHAERLVGVAGCDHGSRLGPHDEAALAMQLLEDRALLPPVLAGGQQRYRCAREAARTARSA
jgi:hypothetical protein